MYRESYSAIRKIITDSGQLILMFILLFSGSFMIFNGDTGGKPPDALRLILSGVFFLGSMKILYDIGNQIRRVGSFRGDWYIELNSDFIILKAPDFEEVKPFKYNCSNIKKISYEAYMADDIWYKWFIYIEENGNETKKAFDLGPFSKERIIDKVKDICGINVTETDIEGVVFEWNYSPKPQSCFSLIVVAIIFLSFIIPSFFI